MIDIYHRVNGKRILLEGDALAAHIASLPTYEQIIEETTQAIEDKLDNFIDDVAKSKGYGTTTMSPTAACMTYAGYDNPYRAEAEAFGVWKASLWPIVFQIQADFLSGDIPEPTFEEIVAQLPIMVWP